MPISAPIPAAGDAAGPGGTGSPLTRLIGIGALVVMAVLLVFAFVLSPPQERVDPDTNLVTGQFDAVRLLYVHFPSILVAYTAFLITVVASAMVLWRKSMWWDITAATAAEIGVVFCALTLITGSIWGRPIWNTWWEWGDVRVMTTLMLLLLYVGYLAYRRAVPSPEVRARRSAVLGLVGFINIIVVNRSVEWWENRTLHQKSTLGELRIEDLTLLTLVIGFVAFGLIFAWLMIHRFRLGWLEYQRDTVGLEQAMAERRAQAGAVDAAIDHPGLPSVPPEAQPDRSLGGTPGDAPGAPS